MQKKKKKKNYNWIKNKRKNKAKQNKKLYILNILNNNIINFCNKFSFNKFFIFIIL